MGSMRARRALAALAIVVTGLAIALPAGAIGRSTRKDPIENTTFRIDVTASAGFTFVECLRFGTAGPQGVTADLLGTGDFEVFRGSRFHARFAVDDVVIDLDGQAVKKGLKGTGTNSNGRTYAYTGVVDPTCTLPPDEV